MANSLLASLYSRIKGSQEDVATMSLCYLIESSDAVKKSVCEYLYKQINKTPRELYFHEQSVGENKERPDIVASSKKCTNALILESKFYAGLTQNQPVAYLTRLMKAGGDGLIFICPEARKITLWKELCNRCENSGLKIDIAGEYYANIDGCSLTIVTWKALLTTIRTTMETSVPFLLHDLYQLEGLCARMDEDEHLPFTPDDLSRDTARQFERMFSFVDRVYEYICKDSPLESDIKIDTKNLKAAASRNGYYRYFRTDMLGCGIDLDYAEWLNTSSLCTPLWLYLCHVHEDGWGRFSIEEIRAFDSYRGENPKKIIDLDGRVYIALSIPPYVTFDEAAKDVAIQVERIIVAVQKQWQQPSPDARCVLNQ